LEAVKLLISQLKITEGIGNEEGDDELIADMVEMETQLYEAIGLVIERIHADDTLVEGMKLAEARIEARRKRFADRNERRKFAIANALQLAKRPKFEHPLVTISRRNAPPHSEVVAEHEIPAKYWKPAEPQLDKRLLLADLKQAKIDGVKIGGAILVEGEMTTAWRWS
jgi:hypothetical protein